MDLNLREKLGRIIKEMNESLLLFGIGINKFKVTNWQDKKPKLLELIDFNDTKVQSCQSDYFKYQTNHHIWKVL